MTNVASDPPVPIYASLTTLQGQGSELQRIDQIDRMSAARI